MSDNKKYYYIKLKDSYFEKDNIKILEAQENGYIYSLILLKLFLKSANHDGCLMMTDRIPYDDTNISTLARVLNHDVAHVKDALTHAIELDLISIQDSQTLWMVDIQGMIGKSSTEADRIRNYRKKLADKTLTIDGVYKCTPEIEIEIEKEIEIEREIEQIPSLGFDLFPEIIELGNKINTTNHTFRLTKSDKDNITILRNKHSDEKTIDIIKQYLSDRPTSGDLKFLFDSPSTIENILIKIADRTFIPVSNQQCEVCATFFEGEICPECGLPYKHTPEEKEKAESLFWAHSEESQKLLSEIQKKWKNQQ